MVKNNNRSNWQKRNFARAAHFFCTFLCCCLVRLQREPSRNFLVTCFVNWNVVRFLVHFFFTAAHFHLALVAASISHFVTTATKLSCCSSKEKISPLFFISRSRYLSPFISLSFAGLPPTFSFSLSFSCSIFQICGHNLSLIHFRLYWLFSCLCFTRRRWLCNFLSK